LSGEEAEKSFLEPKQDIDDTRPDPVEEAGETTAADSIPTPADTRPVGEGTTVSVEGEAETK
jgi:hypothetical protein